MLQSKCRHIRERALCALDKVNGDELFIIEHVRQAISNNSDIGLIPIWIAISKGMADLGTYVAPQLNSEVAEMRLACAMYIGRFRIEGYDKELTNLLDDNSFVSGVEGDDEYTDFYETVSRYYVMPNSVSKAALYAPDRLRSL